MRLPDFLIIGAQKCGTTAARFNLARHPHVAFNADLDEGHELHFFDHDKRWRQGIDWYQSHFKHAAPMLGEKTPNYFASELLPRIKSVLPHARLLVYLRNPADRAYSHWNHFNQTPAAAGWGWRVRSFERALDEFPSLRHNGHYDDVLTTLFSLFPRSQVHVSITERTQHNMAEEYERTLNFLGLTPVRDAHYERVHSRRYAQAMEDGTRDQLNAYFAARIEKIRVLLNDPLPEWL